MTKKRTTHSTSLSIIQFDPMAKVAQIPFCLGELGHNIRAKHVLGFDVAMGDAATEQMLSRNGTSG